MCIILDPVAKYDVLSATLVNLLYLATENKVKINYICDARSDSLVGATTWIWYARHWW
jgi:hypothetical protein